MSPLELMMKEAMDDASSGQKILPEAAIARLREAAEWIAAPNTFKVGDIVTPRLGVNVKGNGDPHLVIGVNEAGFDKGVYDAGQPGSSNVCNILVVFFTRGGGHVVTCCLTHWQLEPYVGEAGQ